MKITPDHLARGAFIYIRQSTADQLANNHESRRRQYGLADRARALGWTDVTVIDDDLGRSGSGVSRPGFERLLAAICEGRVGAVFAIEASRLARNGRDWHTLIEFDVARLHLILDLEASDVDDGAMPVALSLLHQLHETRRQMTRALRRKACGGRAVGIIPPPRARGRQPGR
jgi:DNA invertase Pin-like site-specific DNA recombinase